MPLNRRRVLQIIGCASASLALPLSAAAKPPLEHRQWQGVVMGASASIDLLTDDGARSDRLIAAVLKDVRRLESLFSLYKPGTAVSKLNATGRLADPDKDFVALMELACGLHRQTDGAFDISVQPLLALYGEHFSSQKAAATGPRPELISKTMRLVDGAAIDIKPDEIRFAKIGMSVTLDGIAQGFISDCVARRLKAGGIERVMVDMGEIVAVGRDGDDLPWRVGLLDPRRAVELSDVVELEDLAIATSGGYGLEFDAKGRYHHLIDPKTGQSARNNLAVSVTAPAATLADGLSTAFSAMDETEMARVLEAYPGVGAHITRRDGSVGVLGAFPNYRRA
jgi:thiamine biosynthesis lipoprotein